MSIHPTAVVSPKAEIGKNVEIGPYTVVEGDVTIGDNTYVDAHVKICQYTTIGPNCRIHYNSLIGGEPQDHSFDPGCVSYTEIGSHTVIREFVTIHRSPQEELKTIVGDHCLIMGFVHLAHDVVLGDRVTIVNHSGLSGHVQVGSGAIISGYNLFHQFCRVGTMAMIGPGNQINLDIPPYCLLGYNRCIYGPNTIGLRRAGLNAEQRTAIRNAIKTYFFKGLSKRDALAEIEKDMTPEVEHFYEFIKSSHRGIMPTTPKKSQEALNGDM